MADTEKTINRQSAISVGLMIVIVSAAVWTAVGLHDIPDLKSEIADVKAGLKENTAAVTKLTYIWESTPSRAEFEGLRKENESLRLRISILEERVNK